MITTTLMMVADPNGAFPNAEPEALLDAAGIIPMFVIDAMREGEATSAKGFMSSMEESYGFDLGDYDMLADGKGAVDSDGVYTYPEDPTLNPILSMETEKGMRVYVYQYGLVAVRDLEGNTVMKRMD